MYKLAIKLLFYECQANKTTVQRPQKTQLKFKATISVRERSKSGRHMPSLPGPEGVPDDCERRLVQFRV